MRVRRNFRAALAAALLAGTALGCGGPHPYPVAGRLVYADGQTASDFEGAEVVFTSEQLRVSASGALDANGRFALTMLRKGDGALPGEYKVVLVPPVDFG